MRAPVRVTHDKQKVIHPTITVQVGHSAHAFIHSGRIVQKAQTVNMKADSARKVLAVHCKTASGHNAVTNLIKAAITVSKGDITAAEATIAPNKAAIAHVSTTMAASSKAVINPDSKATMHVHSSKAIVLATMRMAKSSKVAINHGSHKVTDAHNKAAIKVGVVIKTTATSTTMAAAIHNKVATTTVTITTITAVTTTVHNRISTPTATLRKTVRVTIPTRNIA